MTRYLLAALMVALMVFLAQPVLAEEYEEQGAEGTEGEDSGDGEGEGDYGSDTEDAITRVPVYEDASAFGVEEEERVVDAFFRIAEDWLYSSEIGSRNVGRVPLWPRGPLKLGGVLIFPYLTSSLGWTSNIYEDEDERSSTFGVIGGGVAGEYLFSGGRASATFGVDYRYKRFFDRHENNFKEVVGGVGLGYKFPRNWWIRAGVKWEHLVDPVRIQDKGEMERDLFYPYIDVGIDEAFGNKVNVEVGLDVVYADFAKREFRTSDRTEWDFHLQVSYPIFKRQTRVYVRYDYLWAERESRRINDLDNAHQVVAGLDGMFSLTKSGRLRGFLEFGYRMDSYGKSRSYQVGSDTIYTDDDDAAGALVVGVGLEYLAGVRTSVDFRILSTMQHSSSSNYQRITRFDLGATHNITRCLVGRVASFFECGNPSDGSSFTRWGAGAGLRWILDDNWDLYTDFDWERRNTSKVGYDSSVLTGVVGATFYMR